MKSISIIVAASLLAVTFPAYAGDATGLTATSLLDTKTLGDGVPLRYPTGDAHLTALMVELAPGGETGLHRHPMPVVGYIVSGEVTVSAEGMAPRVFKAGEAFVETSVWHNGRNEGREPVRILAIYLGAEGQLRVEKKQGGDGHY